MGAVLYAMFNLTGLWLALYSVILMFGVVVIVYAVGRDVKNAILEEMLTANGYSPQHLDILSGLHQALETMNKAQNSMTESLGLLFDEKMKNSFDASVMVKCYTAIDGMDVDELEALRENLVYLKMHIEHGKNNRLDEAEDFNEIVDDLISRIDLKSK